MEAARKPTPTETDQVRSKLFLPSAVNIAIPELLQRTRDKGREHGLTFRYDKLGILKPNRITKGDEVSVMPATLRERIISRVAVNDSPPVILHTHVSPASRAPERTTPLVASEDPGFNILPSHGDFLLAALKPGAWYLTASDFGVVAMTEKHKGAYPGLEFLSLELFDEYLQLRQDCRKDPSLIGAALQALADFWKPHGDVYVRFGVRSTPLDLVTPSEVADVPIETELAS